MNKILSLILFTILIINGSCSAQQNTMFEVLTVEASSMVQEENNQELVTACKNWKLSKKDVLLFFEKGEVISSYVKNNHFYFLPCEITGTIKKNDTIFNFSINAGATAELHYKEKVYYYGCTDTICDKLVLMPPDIGDEEEK